MAVRTSTAGAAPRERTWRRAVAPVLALAFIVATGSAQGQPLQTRYANGSASGIRLSRPRSPRTVKTADARAHYAIYLRAWIPFKRVADPRQPFFGSYLGVSPFGGVADNCYSPPFFAQFATTVISTY